MSNTADDLLDDENILTVKSASALELLSSRLLKDKNLAVLNERKNALSEKLRDLKLKLQSDEGLSKKEHARLIRNIVSTNVKLSEINDKINGLDINTENVETLREKLIRTGKLNPLSKLNVSSSSKRPRDEENELDYVSSSISENESYSDFQLSDVEAGDEEKFTIIDEGISDEECDIFHDDGDEATYQRRLQGWAHSRREKRFRKLKMPLETHNIDWDPIDEMYMDIPSLNNDNIVNSQLNLRVPRDIYKKLFGYQKVGIQWLSELHIQKTGGIIGDEMGLGKTIQIISFLAALAHSKLLTGPILIVCPATVLRQWVDEFHKWWPPFRVAILHSSGSAAMGKNIDEEESKKVLASPSGWNLDDDFKEDFLEDRRGLKQRRGKMLKKEKFSIIPKISSQLKNLISHIIEDGHVLITTYASICNYRSVLLPVKWSYCILDEGHKIRNPDAEVTLYCKKLKTAHRLILSGTPIQNNLVELWSLFDFVFPGKLGTLPIFQSQFSVPIRLGGYVNANNIQVQTAYQCALALRDLINPYMLRRMKSDVAADLPPKDEQVLFCKLTENQKSHYVNFLKSDDVKKIMNGKLNALFGIDILRKICNHPDLLTKKEEEKNEGFGDISRSGKMKVVDSLLKYWRGSHKVLIFCQTRQMQDIIESFLLSKDYVYQRMDGTTPIKSRINLVNEFNSNESIYIFLLTTKVGGLGINLTGADRIIIFDPDWNPSTDLQARERAWRVGQKKPVTVYRLMTSNTIEEKIYHRQIYKQFLTNKILKDPMQRRFFKSNDLADLFSLNILEDNNTTETGQLFAEMNAEITNSSIPAMHIANLAAVEEFQQLQESELTTQGTSDPSNTILAALFENSGIHSVVQHDAIMDAAAPERVLVEKEAVGIATAALAVLRADRRRVAAARSEDMFEPTWTGSSGVAGGPKRFGKSANSGKSREFGFGNGQVSGFTTLEDGEISSTDILKGLQKRRSVGPTSFDLTGEDSNAEHTQLVSEIRDYLIQRSDLSASTTDIIEKFKKKVEEKISPEIFKQLLKGIAVLDKSRGIGVWCLKQEFL
ncbi:hypothetical protein HK096_004209 [Nowakowskiella sp. JEL0078]|nr:hypothetical protein HK096_004209 [Nowakowskiella sp. JEL0078]